MLYSAAPIRVLLALGLGAAVLSGGEPLSAQVLPLPTRSATASPEAILAVLNDLRHGQTASLAALPPEAFITPLALPGAESQAIQPRWSAAVPGILATLDPNARAAIEAVFDQLYHDSLPGRADAQTRARLAADFLPAPTARAVLSHAGDVAFDHGRFADYLGIARLLSEGGAVAGASELERQRVALLLSGRGAEVEPARLLPPPGQPQPTAAQPVAAPDLGIRWHTASGWLLACDPWNQVRWQVRADRQASITCGDGAALIADSEGLRAIADDGTITHLPTLPAGARVLCVAGGAAWFATGTNAWRLALDHAGVQELALGSVPLGPPLVRGATSLWLTGHDLLLFEGGRQHACLRHGLPAGDGWHLASAGDQPLVCSPDGHTWRLASLTEQITQAAPLDRAQLLIQATRYQEAVAALAGRSEADSERGRSLLVTAHLGLGEAHVLANLTSLLPIAQSVQDQVLLRQAALQALAAEPPAQRDETLVAHLNTDIDALAVQADVLLSPCSVIVGARSDFSEEPSAWAHAFTSAGYLRARHAQDQASMPPDQLGAPVESRASGTAPADADLDEHRLGDGGSLYHGFELRLSTHIDRKEVRCFDAENHHLLWWHHWDGLPTLVAPGNLLVCRDGAAVVVEGQRRLRALALDTGALIADLDCASDGLPSGSIAILAANRVAVLGPAAIDTTLTLYGPQRITITLPAPGRWLMALGGHAVVALADGSVLAYPGAIPVALPADLAKGHRAPTLLPEGLAAGGQLFPWKH